MRQFKQFSVVVLVVLGIVIALQNRESVETQLLFVSVSMPRAVLLFITLAIGFVSGILASMIFSRKWVARDK